MVVDAVGVVDFAHVRKGTSLAQMAFDKAAAAAVDVDVVAEADVTAYFVQQLVDRYC